MILKKVDYCEFMLHKDFLFDQIPKAQNSQPEYYEDVFEYYRENLKESDQNFMIFALENREIIGCAFIKYYAQESRFFLLNVNTRKDFWHTSKKVATKVVEFGLNEFFKTQKSIFLWVHEQNIVAQKLYEKSGFEKTEYYPPNLEFLAVGNDSL